MLKFVPASTIAAIATLASGAAMAASVTYTHSASVGFSGSNGFTDADSATSVAVDSDPDAIDIGIGGFSFYEASVQISPISNFLITGGLYGAGKLTAEVNISAEITTGATEQLSFSPFVIVEGGFLDTIDSVNSSLMLEWDVTGVTLAPETYKVQYGGTQGPPTVSVNGIEFDTLSNTVLGALDATKKPSGNSIEIPTTLQRINLNGPIPMPGRQIIGPGQTVTLDYSVRITAQSDQNGFTEGMAFRFQDPLLINQDPAFNLGDLRSTTLGVAAVPVPAS